MSQDTLPPPEGPVAPPPEDPLVPPHQEAWKTVYFGQISQDLVPTPPQPPEAPEDELTREALEDPEALAPEGHGNPAPTAWRLVVMLMVAVVALAMVFWR